MKTLVFFLLLLIATYINGQEKYYVIAENGLIYREEPNINAKKIGTFDLGTELIVLKKTGIEFEVKENGNTINGEWVKVKSKIDRDDSYWIRDSYSHSGYVFSGFIKDSANIDFKQLPIFANIFKFPKVNTKEGELSLTLERIDSIYFHELKNGYNSKISIDSTIIYSKSTGTEFNIETENSNIKFRCGKNYMRPCYVHLGFLKPLNSHIIGEYGDGIYETFLIDGSNSSKLLLGGCLRGGNLPIISKNNKRLATFSSVDTFDSEEFFGGIRSCIKIYDITNITNLGDIDNYHVYTNEKWSIKDLIWIDDNTFVLEIYDRTEYDKNKGMRVLVNQRFLKATINNQHR